MSAFPPVAAQKQTCREVRVGPNAEEVDFIFARQIREHGIRLQFDIHLDQGQRHRSSWRGIEDVNLLARHLVRPM